MIKIRITISQVIICLYESNIRINYTSICTIIWIDFIFVVVV